MPGKREPRNNEEEVSALKMSAAVRRPEAGSSAPLNSEALLEAIRYLDPDLNRDTTGEGDNGIVGCVSALVALFYLAIYLWLRHWVR